MKGDEAVEKGADKLETLADKAAAKGGVAGKLADSLAENASFLRRLKPSLMVARAKGEARKNREPGSARAHAPAGPQLGPRSAEGKQAGPNPFVLAGAAFGIGTLLAKIIDWRGHAHPRR
ncbi:MAG: hypothetical protein H0V45_10830 [Actinobacteria bacterium]|nr:hypothetical protein [Actinomycetota bacterium]